MAVPISVESIGMDPRSCIDVIIATHWHTDHVRRVRCAGAGV